MLVNLTVQINLYVTFSTMPIFSSAASNTT